MDSEVITEWLAHLDSSSPPEPELVVWPPTPRTLGYHWQQIWEAKRRERERDCAVAAIMSPTKKKAASELDDGQQRDDRRGGEGNLIQIAAREARARRRAEMASSSGDSEAERQTRAGTDGPAKQQQVGVDNELAFPDRSRVAPISSSNISTPPTTQSRPQLPFPRLSPPSHSGPESPQLPSAKGSSTKGPSTESQDPTRPKSPMKGAQDLLKLDKPVHWVYMALNELLTKMNNSGSASLYRSIEDTLDEGFMPAELRNILDAKLCLRGKKAFLFAERPVRPVTESDLYEKKLEQGLSQPVQQDEIPKLSANIHMQRLISELNVLHTIRDRTLDHIEYELAEASWNEDIHKPMLHLATLHTPSILAVNITCATIITEYKPKVSAYTLPIPADGKMVDFAMVLQSKKDDKITESRIAHFLDTLDYPTFNQSNTAPLVYMPSGVFIETKTSGGSLNEAKTQLGIWLASWFNRVSRFPWDDEANIEQFPPPAIPLIIIHGASWKLWFAFDKRSEYEIYGPIDLGDTTRLLDLYRILAVLRVLAQWMATDFRTWVDECLKSAGV
ncbi:hypothetical protein F4860DRAFT_346202 [Xylaria cubensis]|nr:hypothetical protein F4860DRAFT_346202 [Xylaria cubensis]